MSDQQGQGRSRAALAAFAVGAALLLFALIAAVLDFPSEVVVMALGGGVVGGVAAYVVVSAMNRSRRG